MTEQHVGAEPPALEAVGLGKRYRDGWALRDCSFRVPVGRICAVVGPNGAGKSTLMSIASHLLVPTEGSVRVLGLPLDDPQLQSRVSFVAQDKPLYTGFTVGELLRLGRDLNPFWDQGRAEEIIAEGRLPLSARIGSLSGGQRTRVSLALAIGKRPELLILDEPMSDLDPLARHQMMGVLMAEAAERGTTVLMSSHVIAELADACDYLLLLSEGRALLAGDIDEIVDSHRLLIGSTTVPRQSVGPELPAALAPHQVIDSRQNGRQLTALVRPDGPVPGDWEASAPTLEEVLLAHLRSPAAPALLTDEARPARSAVAA
ncbi:ABC transporter ATP-binding protein [Kitasatospora sp. NPDC050543]|uniref:ABC transporter ATP-binding protein n=1 Tax=Kitasatospora sp. NPDC050543 TaxID=3364054 RepID=UPI0037AA946B